MDGGVEGGAAQHGAAAVAAAVLKRQAGGTDPLPCPAPLGAPLSPVRGRAGPAVRRTAASSLLPAGDPPPRAAARGERGVRHRRQAVDSLRVHGRGGSGGSALPAREIWTQMRRRRRRRRSRCSALRGRKLLPSWRKRRARSCLRHAPRTAVSRDRGCAGGGEMHGSTASTRARCGALVHTVPCAYRDAPGRRPAGGSLPGGGVRAEAANLRLA